MLFVVNFQPLILLAPLFETSKAPLGCLGHISFAIYVLFPEVYDLNNDNILWTRVSGFIKEIVGLDLWITPLAV